MFSSPSAPGEAFWLCGGKTDGVLKANFSEITEVNVAVELTLPLANTFRAFMNLFTDDGNRNEIFCIFTGHENDVKISL